MTLEERNKVLYTALLLAGEYAREHPPGDIMNLTNNEVEYLYTETDNDPFGERFVKYWISQAIEERKKIVQNNLI